MLSNKAVESKPTAIVGKLVYCRDDILGQGGFGSVFQGKWVPSDGNEVEVAIKRLQKANLSHTFRDREQKQKELDHPNVVKLFHVEEDDNFVYFALELCEASLDQVFLPENNKKKYLGNLPSEIDFILQLSTGLEYIHRKKIVHRDIKPGNVLVSNSSKTGEVVMKWADFGLSKTTKMNGEFSLSGDRGTQCYWAPEFFTRTTSHDGGRIIMTVKSDTFAFACVAFQFLTNGIHPFGSSREEIIKNLSQSNPMKIRELSSDHFAFIILKKVLAVKTEERLDLDEIILMLTSHKKINEVYITKKNRGPRPCVCKGANRLLSPP